jgi:hypothetical protein
MLFDGMATDIIYESTQRHWVHMPPTYSMPKSWRGETACNDRLKHGVIYNTCMYLGLQYYGPRKIRRGAVTL